MDIETKRRITYEMGEKKIDKDIFNRKKHQIISASELKASKSIYPYDRCIFIKVSCDLTVSCQEDDLLERIDREYENNGR
jgi:hypothetical protein